jgi:hypothetical protein
MDVLSSVGSDLATESCQIWEKNSVALVCELTIPTERPPLVGEVSANSCGQKGVAWSPHLIPYGRNLGF